MKRPLTAILAGVALLLGGCNLSGESSTGQGTVNLSVGISKPTAGAHSNQRDVEVRIAATGGRVESAKLAYAGPSSGEIPLTPSGGVWRGTLPESLSSGTYTLKAEARVGSFIKESGPVVFVFVKDKPQITFVITTPAEGEEVGPGAQKEIVAVTIGINGTLPPGVNVSKVEIYINGQYVGDALNATAGDGSQIFIYTWDTTQLAPGHDPTLSGDRVITARVYYTGGDTWTSGVLVSYNEP